MNLKLNNITQNGGAALNVLMAAVQQLKQDTTDDLMQILET